MTDLLPVTQEDREPRLRMFLEILSQMGGQSDASEYRWNWINAFLHEREGFEPDTFNAACDRGFTTVSHDSDTDQSTVYLTNAGREYLSHRPAKPEAGYLQAFHQLAQLMGIGAQPVSPAEVWESQMLPKLKAVFSPAEPGEGDKPVAFMYTVTNGQTILSLYRIPHDGHTETPLYARPTPAAPGDVVERVKAALWAADGAGYEKMAIDAIAALGSGERGEGELLQIVQWLRAVDKGSHPADLAEAIERGDHLKAGSGS